MTCIIQMVFKLVDNIENSERNSYSYNHTYNIHTVAHKHFHHVFV